MREELAAPVAADGDERELGRRAKLVPDRGERAIDERAPDSRSSRGVSGRARNDARNAARLGVERRRATAARCSPGGMPARVGAEAADSIAGGLARYVSAGGGGAPAETVSTS